MAGFVSPVSPAGGTKAGVVVPDAEGTGATAVIDGLVGAGVLIGDDVPADGVVDGVVVTGVLVVILLTSEAVQVTVAPPPLPDRLH